MAKSSNAGSQPLTVVSSVRGQMSVRVTKHGTVIQKWPRKRTAATSGYEFYRQQEFAFVARLMKALEPRQRETAEAMAKGTSLTWRDVATAAAFGTYYQIFGPDGERWYPSRMVAPNPQIVLDLVGDTIGAIVYRAAIGWVILPPGDADQVLSIGVDGVPIWVTPTGGGGTSDPNYLPPLAADYTTRLNAPTLTDSVLGLGIWGALSSNKLYGAFKALPAVDRTYLFRVQQSAWNTSQNGCGLVIGDSGAGKYILCGAWLQSSGFTGNTSGACVKFATPTTGPSDFGGEHFAIAGPIWGKLVYVAASKHWYFSASQDGINWWAVHDDASYLASPDLIGFGANSSGSGYAASGAITYYKEI